MQKIIFTEEYCKPANLHPFTLTRHMQDIRVGILTIREKWESMLQLPSFDKWEDHYLSDDNSIRIGEHKDADMALLVHANILPTKSMISKIKKLQDGGFLTAGKNGSIAYAFSDKQVAGPHTIKVNQQVKFESPLKLLQYPWEITRLNDWAIREDFNLITSKRKTAPISETNSVIDPSQVFMEDGAKAEYCILNASAGPIYIGKKVEIMEGSMIRGPVALCEGAVVKMGTRIYGAVTIGPHCTVGGELKNVVMFGYSNKAHDGYLGDSVIGEWCNLGAGTSNSNIKNNCSEVKYWIDEDKKEMNAGLKGGLLMGDYSRAAINTSFNTGTVVGVNCNVFATGLTPKLIPSFTWGSDGITRYELSKALQDLDKWKNLKGMSVTAREKQILTDIYKKY